MSVLIFYIDLVIRNVCYVKMTKKKKQPLDEKICYNVIVWCINVAFGHQTFESARLLANRLTLFTFTSLAVFALKDCLN